MKAIIPAGETDSQIIHRNGRDVMALQCASLLQVSVSGRLSQDTDFGTVRLTDDTALSIPLTAGEPRVVDIADFGGLLEFKLVASSAVAAEKIIYIGMRDFK